MSYDSLYLPEIREIVLHQNDPDLSEIRIPMPKCPDIRKVEGYGLHPKDQFFKHDKMPDRLVRIEVDVRRYYRIKEKDSITIDHVYDYLQDKKRFYVDEIKWVKKMIHRRYHGYWVFVNGRPTYVNRWYWFFLNQWWVDNDARVDGLPDYRERDWMWWSANLYLYETTECPYSYKLTYTDTHSRTKYFSKKLDLTKFKRKLDEVNSKLESKYQLPRYVNILVEDGYFIVDKGVRVNYGLAYPKGRRDGATFRAQCNNYLVVTEGFDKHGGIQSKVDDDAESVFQEKLIKPWQKIWFFFRPYHDGSNNPKSVINFQKADNKKNSVMDAGGTGSWIDYRASGNMAYDGEKMHFLHHDEVGKKDKGAQYDTKKRWGVAKKALSQGGGRKIVGWAMMTSTTNKADEGGSEFYEVCKQSMYNDRNENGQTTSGLIVIFIPAHIGLEGFIDVYGNTVIETPDRPVKGIDGRWIDVGSREFLMNSRQDLEEKEDWEGLNEEVRQHPMFYMECFRQSNVDSGFNLHILNSRLQELKSKPAPNVRYNLEWVNGDFGGDVEMIEDEHGRFISSWIPHRQHRNRKVFDVINNHYGPIRPIGCLGTDPFRFNQTKFKRKSNAAGVIYIPRDKEVDRDDVAKSNWKSAKFSTTYNNRVDDKDEFAEDMLKLAIWQGVMVYPENNIPLIHDKFLEWGFGGYLMYYVDQFGRMSPMSGRQTNEKVKQDIFALYATHINNMGWYDDHEEILEECMKIPGPEGMKDYDVFTAGGYAMMGAEIMSLTSINEDVVDNEIIEIFEQRTY